MAELFDDFDSSVKQKPGLFDDFVPPDSQPRSASDNWFIKHLSDAWDNATRSPSGTTGFQGVADSIGPTGRILANAATGNVADPLIGWLGAKFGGADPTAAIANERAQTKSARDAAGAGVIPLDVAGYVLGPGKVLGPLSKGGGLVARTLGGAAEGGLSGAGYALGGDVGNPNADMLNDAGSGAVGGAIFGGAAAPAASIIGGAVNKALRNSAPPIPSTESLADAKNALFNKLDFTYDSKDATQLANDVAVSFNEKGLTPYSTPKEFWFNNDIQNGLQNNDVSMQNLRDLKARAKKELSPVYAATFGKNVDDFINTVDPTNGSAEEASSALKAANRANSNYRNSSMLDDWIRDAANGGQSVPKSASAYIRSGNADRFLGGVDDPRYQSIVDLANSSGGIGELLNSHQWGISHHVAAPAIGGLLAAGGVAAGHAFEWPLAYLAATTAAPAVASLGVAGTGVKSAIDATRRVLTDTQAAKRMSDAERALIQQLIMRGANSGWNEASSP